jgi:glycosyltransferase involved in cell wall biosynthesis
MKVALVHDWLTGMRGGEKCLEAFCEIFPEADLYTLLHVPGSVSATIEDRRIVVSKLRALPAARKLYRCYLPLMPMAIEAFDLGGYDLVLSSSHCVASGVTTGPNTPHISYTHTPMRYIWDRGPTYLANDSAPTRRIKKAMFHLLRVWDVSSSARVDKFVANSRFVARRIRKYYRRSSVVVPPPVDTDFYQGTRKPGDYFLVVSALVPYKRLDLAIRAFNQMGRPLKVVGSGPLLDRLRKLAGPTVELTGWISDEQLRECYSECRAVIVPSVEDFGIVPLEANAMGCPVIALGKGGVLDSVTPINRPDWGGRALASHAGQAQAPTGLFFGEESPAAIADAVRQFDDLESRFRPSALRQHARGFDRKVFKERMERLLEAALDEWSEERKRKVRLSAAFGAGAASPI